MDRESLTLSYKAHTMDHGHMIYGMAREYYDIVMEMSLTDSGKTTRSVMTIVTQIKLFDFFNCVIRTHSASWAWHYEVR